MDIHMPGMSGLKPPARSRPSTEIQIVILTVSDEDEHLFEAIKSGAGLPAEILTPRNSGNYWLG
jgi:CheY-like chemotaxis protein